MDTKTMINQLKYEAEKHKNDSLFTGQTNITALCNDVIPKLEKLAEYETAEEDGRLVVLPCKVGETVYAILHRRTPCTAQGREFEEYSCSGCEAEKCDSYLEYFVWENKFATLEWIVGNLRKFGKTVFSTREEAEKALEAMKRAMNRILNLSD